MPRLDQPPKTLLDFRHQRISGKMIYPEKLEAAVHAVQSPLTQVLAQTA